MFGLSLGSNYFPYRPEVNLAYERDYKSYPDYNDTYYYGERESAPLIKYNYSRYGAGTSNIRKPQMGISASNHRRTMSNISTNTNSVNRGIHYTDDDINTVYNPNQTTGNSSSHSPKLHQSPAPRSASANRMRVYENISYTSKESAFNYLTSNADFTNVDRPSSLLFDNNCGTKLRSSLKKYTPIRTSTGLSGGNVNSGASNMTPNQHIPTTPTNPTPPDSLGSDDSSYLSAKEGSISSQSRVRFSPETLLDQSIPIHHDSGLISSTIAPIRRLSRTRHSISGTALPSTTTS